MESAPTQRILVVDDTQKNVHLLGTLLKRQNFLINVAYNGSEAIEVAKKVQPDLILLDIMMPGMDGYQTCEILKKDPATSAIPIIFLTAKSETADIVKGFEVGAVDYVTKPFNSTVLLARVRTHLKLRYMLKDIEAQRAELATMVMIDGLTKLYNHKFIFEILSKEMKEATRYGRPLSIIMFDLDLFKKVNDTFGHPAGDEVLVKVSDTLRSVIRDSDSAGRYGGEEFLILLPSTDLKSAVLVAEKVRKDIAKLTFEHPELQVTISGGVAAYSTQNTLDLINQADQLLYKAKAEGRNQIQA